MTRTFQFTLNDLNWHTIWSLITSLPNFDATMSNFSYIPSQVSFLEIQSPSPANAGMNLYLADAKSPDALPSLQTGINVTAGGSEPQNSNRNNIDLKSKIISTDTVGALVNVAIISI